MVWKPPQRKIDPSVPRSIGPIIPRTSLEAHPTSWVRTVVSHLHYQLHCLALLILTHPLVLPAFSLTSTYIAGTFPHVHLHVHLHSPSSLTHSLTLPKLKPKNYSVLTLSSYRFVTPFTTGISMFSALSV